MRQAVQKVWASVNPIEKRDECRSVNLYDDDSPRNVSADSPMVSLTFEVREGEFKIYLSYAEGTNVKLIETEYSDDD